MAQALGRGRCHVENLLRPDSRKLDESVIIIFWGMGKMALGGKFFRVRGD